MKSVLLSIKPKYCELIASEKKTVEIRKNRPKIDMPFKVYMYQTRDVLWFYKILEWLKLYQRKVIGEFICDRIDFIDVIEICGIFFHIYEANMRLEEKSCLSDDEIDMYLRDREGYAWHISDLVIYDKPKELSEFLKYNRTENDCYYQHLSKPNRCQECKKCVLKRPPQSWCYVEELEDLK